MNITTLALTFKIDPAEWANEYGIPVAEAADHIRDAFERQYGHIAETLTKQWPMMRDSATVTVSAPGKALDTLIDNGLTFAECVTVFAAQQNDTHAAVIESARADYHEEGSVEIDSNAIVSDSDEGAYVMAWVWVPNGDGQTVHVESDDDTESNT